MQKFAINKIALISLLIFSVTADIVFAAPSNGTRLPPKGRAEAGYEYNVMFRRSLDRSYGNISTRDHFYTVSLGIFDWLSLDAKIGLGDVTQSGGTHLPKLEYNTAFAGGYGFRIKCFSHEKSGVTIVVGGQHISVHPQDRSIDNDKYESFLDDWQISGILTKKFNFISPYVGVKGSDSEIVYKINKHNKKRRYSENHIGLICGSDIFLFNDKLRVNIEGRFIDETALSVQVAYLF